MTNAAAALNFPAHDGHLAAGRNELARQIWALASSARCPAWAPETAAVLRDFGLLEQLRDVPGDFVAERNIGSALRTA